MTALGTIDGGDAVTINLEALIGSHLCVAANSGGGKSGAIRKLLEATHGQVQHVVLDAEDEFYTLRERYDYVIAGGDGGDATATVAGAADLARAALAHDFSLIAQINDLGDSAGDFIAAFLDGLVNAPRNQWRPVLVVIDEAQRFAPTGAPSSATAAIKDLLQRGRKRGFTGIVATTRISELHPGVRGLCNNWLLGYVGQSLDRRTAADQLGFSQGSAEAKGLQQLERRQFWGFGPAIARQPLLIRIADVETTIVRSGQAKVPTPPAPEALRVILSGLASAAPAEVVQPGMAEISGTQELVDEISDLRGKLVQAERVADEAYERGKAAGIAVGIARARAAVDALRIPEVMAEDASQPDGGSHVDRGAARARIEPEAPAGPRKRQGSASPDKPAGASPAAAAIADLLDRVNPAQLTWNQAATMTGRKASGGNFNAARKWLRESGRIVEEGDLIRSAADAPAGLTRAEAIALWKAVLTSPAPKMIDALLSCSRAIGKDDLGQLIDAAPHGGNFNNGLSQLRRNGLLVDVGGGFRIAKPLPGEAV